MATLLIGGVLAATPAAAVPVGSPIVSAGSYYDLTSKITKRTYRIFVWVPKTPPPPHGFPVIYILDGNWYFGMAADTAMLQAATGELPPAVIVGIGYPVTDSGAVVPLRMADMSLPADPSNLPPQLQKLGVTPGGLDYFLRFLNEEARPFVANLAPVDRSCESIFGHSLGGLAVLRALFTNPNNYQAYIAASPAIWWADKAVLADEADFTKRARSGDISGRLLLTIGGLEQQPSAQALKRNPGAAAAAQRARMVDNVRDLAARLSRQHFPHFAVNSLIFAGERHNSVVPAALNRALHFGLQCTGGD